MLLNNFERYLYNLGTHPSGFYWGHQCSWIYTQPKHASLQHAVGQPKQEVTRPNARFFKKWAYPGLFLFIFVLFLLQFQYKLKKAQMVCLGFEPGATGWQAQTKPQSYGSHPNQMQGLKHFENALKSLISLLSFRYRVQGTDCQSMTRQQTRSG